MTVVCPASYETQTAQNLDDKPSEIKKNVKKMFRMPIKRDRKIISPLKKSISRGRYEHEKPI
jgi:hypothetical protein